MAIYADPAKAARARQSKLFNTMYKNGWNGKNLTVFLCSGIETIRSMDEDTVPRISYFDITRAFVFFYEIRAFYLTYCMCLSSRAHEVTAVELQGLEAMTKSMQAVHTTNKAFFKDVYQRYNTTLAAYEKDCLTTVVDGSEVRQELTDGTELSASIMGCSRLFSFARLTTRSIVIYTPNLKPEDTAHV